MPRALQAGPDGRAEDIELGQETGERGETGHGQQDDRKNRPDPGVAEADPGEIVQLAEFAAGTAHGRQGGERADPEK